MLNDQVICEQIRRHYLLRSLIKLAGIAIHLLPLAIIVSMYKRSDCVNKNAREVYGKQQVERKVIKEEVIGHTFMESRI